MTQANLSSLITAMSTSRVLVVGDIMLDRFVYGDVSRISPESPVPVLAATRESEMLGGCGNVAANLRGLDVAVSVIALVGADAEGQTVSALLSSLKIPTDGLLAVLDRPTVVKTRFVAGSQHMLRVDSERILPPADDIETALLEKIKAVLPGHQVLVLSDYGKGVLSDRIIKESIALAKAQNIAVLVDPKGRDFRKYGGASVVTPNRRELAEATDLPTSSDADIIAAAEKIITECGIAAVVATRSQDGLSVIQGDTSPLHIKADALEVFDVSGAGDTVIATIAAGLACGASLEQAAMLANTAGGIVVAKIGTAAIRGAELLQRLEHGDTVVSDLHDWDAARERVQRWKAQGYKVGFTNGCFDILHAGHVNYLNEAKSLCDKLVLGLNHDKSVRILKGPTRPVNTELDRATVMNGLGAVDMVVLFGATEAGADNTPCRLIEKVQPDIFFKGGDYTVESLPEAKVVQAYGGEVRIMGLTEGLSTTKTIEKIGASKKV